MIGTPWCTDGSPSRHIATETATYATLSRPEQTKGIRPMAAIITLERPDSTDSVTVIMELEAHLEPLYPAKSRHGYSIEKLIAQAVAFFVLRDDDTPAGCGGIQLFGTAYGELKRMYVRAQFRGLGFGK